MIFSLLSLLVGSSFALTASDVTLKYIETSMDFTSLFKEQPEFNEQEIHDVSNSK